VWVLRVGWCVRSREREVEPPLSLPSLRDKPCDDVVPLERGVDRIGFFRNCPAAPERAVDEIPRVDGFSEDFE